MSENHQENSSLVVTTIRPWMKGVRVWGSDGGKKRVIQLNGELASTPLDRGDCIFAKGSLVKEDTGHVLVADQIMPARMSSPIVFDFLKRSDRFQQIGLGESRIAKLQHAFGQMPGRLVRLLNGFSPEELDQICGTDVANKVRNAWKEFVAETEAVKFLVENKISPSAAKAAYSIYRSETIKKVTENPYRLMPIIGFKRADKFAAAMGLPLDSSDRLAAAATHVINYEVSETGSSVFDVQHIKSLLGKMRIDGEAAIQAGAEKRQLVVYNGNIMTMAHWKMETRVREYFGTLVDRRHTAFFPYEIDETLDVFEQVERCKLTSEQRYAVHSVMNNWVSSITGGAGVGKTHTMNALKFVYELLIGGTVYATALSAIAVDRVREATGLATCHTLAKLLHPKSMMKSDLLKAGSLLIIDESSMIGIPELYRMALANIKCRMVFVGDTNQIQAISYGEPFRQIVDNFPTTKLTQIFRQQGSEIPEAAAQALIGVRPTENALVSYLPMDNGAIAEKAVSAKAKVICGRRRTCLIINKKIQKLRATNEPAATLNGIELYVGDVVVFGKNNYELDIYNGSFGKFAGFDPSGDLMFNINGGLRKEIPYLVAITLDIELGYAVTAHRAQGAGFNRVIVVAERSRICTKNWLYTGITRAKARCWLTGDTAYCSGVESVHRKTQRITPVVS